MVKSQRDRDGGWLKNSGLAGVVGRLRMSFGSGEEDRGDGVDAGVPPRVGISVELSEKLNHQPCLLPRLTDGRLLERFAIVNKASRQGPAMRGIFPFDEDDSPVRPGGPYNLDDNVHGRHRVPKLFSRHHALRER